MEKNSDEKKRGSSRKRKASHKGKGNSPHARRSSSSSDFVVSDCSDSDEVDICSDYVEEDCSLSRKSIKKECAEIDDEKASSSKTSVHRKLCVEYQANHWSPQFLYRTMSDLTVAAIRLSGSEGSGRTEIGRFYGMNTRSKTGNRKVSRHIINALKLFPAYFGQYQKMEGRCRTLRYYYKFSSGPKSFNTLFAEWKNINGSDCPFTMGQVIKFPNANLSTLRISDVSLRRLMDIVRLIKEKSVIVTMARLHKKIIEIEKGYEYGHLIDKRSIRKCLKALEKVKLLHVFETTVRHDETQHKIEIICRWEFDSVDHPAIEKAIVETIDEYNFSGRIFPTGQFKCGKDKIKELSENCKIEKNGFSSDMKLEEVDESTDEISIERRLTLFRLNLLRRIKRVNVKHSQVNDMQEKDAESQENLEVMDQFEEDTIMTSNERDGTSSMDYVPAQKKLKYDPTVNYGQQNKMIRCYILHQFIWHFVYGLPDGTRPTIYERFHPIESGENRDCTIIEDCPVYVDDESPYRFVPYLPPFKGLPRGWFMFEDLMKIFPISLFFLIAAPKTKFDGIEKYLEDPVKRHMLISDLPVDLRHRILTNKRALKQIENHLLNLCGFGLVRLGENPNPKKFQMMISQFFLVLRSGVLWDTSTSARGYACVSLPIDQYKQYIYDFKSLEDVQLYWHHLRMIVQSTPLAFRIDDQSQNEDVALNKNRGLGTYDKSKIIQAINEKIDLALPVPPNDGCAGFNSQFFVHMKRHWDLNPQPINFVSWFLQGWRRSFEKNKKIIQSKVQRFQKAWDSQREMQINDKYVESRPHSIKMRTLSKKMRRSLSALSADNPALRRSFKRKRKPDHIDLIAEERKTHMRTRFSARERHMLLIIRAVGFFLNPVYRFWLDPRVIRDIMHQYVPESQNKTVQSLISASVRDIVKQGKMTYLKRLVKSLTSSPEMRQIRFQLALNPPNTNEKKREFFIVAFNTAMRHLHRDSHNVCSAKDTDDDFNIHMSKNNIKITTEIEQNSIYPARSVKPNDLSHLQHCVAYNIVVSTLLQQKNLNNLKTEATVEQIATDVLSCLLERMRMDGLISRTRLCNDEDVTVAWTCQTSVSHYFRHFFNHRFHQEIVEQMDQVYHNIDSGEKIEEDSAGAAAAYASCFYKNGSFEFFVGKDVLDVFESTSVEQLRSGTKQLRYLESADLKLEKITVKPFVSVENDDMPMLRNVIVELKRLIPIKLFKKKCFHDFLLDYSVEQRRILRNIYKQIEESHMVGSAIDEIVVNTNESDKSKVYWALDELENATQIIRVGIDCIRFVLDIFSESWIVYSGDFAFFPAPWSTSSGDVDVSTVRWMAEGILCSIVNRPGIAMNDLKLKYSFALQPRFFMDLIKLLERFGCIVLKQIRSIPANLNSPFLDEDADELVNYIIPVEYALERFCRIFSSVKIAEIVAANEFECA